MSPHNRKDGAMAERENALCDEELLGCARRLRDVEERLAAMCTGPAKRQDLIGGPDHKPFKIYTRGERRPFDLGGAEPVVFGALRWAPIDAAGNVTLTAEALCDLCNYAYRDGWRFGSAAHAAADKHFEEGTKQ